MGWERKKRGPAGGYYYRSVRTPIGVKKISLGRAGRGHEAADKQAFRVLAREQAEALLLADRDDADEVMRSTADLRDWGDTLLSAWMIAAGYHKHRGEWRMNDKSKRKPRYGSRAWEQSLADDPQHAKSTIMHLAQRAETGNAEAVGLLLGWLERFPDMRSLVRALDDLPAKVLRAWVDRLVGGDALQRRAVEDEVATMRTEMLGAVSSLTDRLLANTVIVAHLAYQRAAVRASEEGDITIQAAYAKLLTAAQVRLQDAIRSWTILTRAKERGRRPPPSLKVFEEIA